MKVLKWTIFALGSWVGLMLVAVLVVYGVALAEGVTEKDGQYLFKIATCSDCHGADLKKPILEESKTGYQARLSLIVAFMMSEQDFITTMRTGRQLSDEAPSTFRGMTNAELQLSGTIFSMYSHRR